MLSRRLLLTGAALGDRFGRRRVFIIGLIGFAFASALGGAAPNSGLLLAARALQGAFGALLAPASLALTGHTLYWTSSGTASLSSIT